MSDDSQTFRKETLDKDLEKLSHVEEATTFVARGLLGAGFGLVFLVFAALFAGYYMANEPRMLIIAAAAAIGAYMALNIGANDVANNVGPAVGSRAMSMGVALVVAAIAESAGALIAGDDVVETISNGIIDPATVTDPSIFIWAMMAALVSSALWVNLSTWIGAPVSTTHSVVGGVMGAGIAAAGFSAVQWPVMGAIVASWVVSPVLGGIIAAVFLAFIKTTLIYQDDKISAARRWIPVLIAVMAGAFAGYLAIKGLKNVVTLNGYSITAIAIVTFILAHWVTRPLIRRQSEGMENRNQSLRRLFHIPLICSAALLSFAHGANDVANAVGPLAAIVHTAMAGNVAAQVSIPLWVMVIGAFGISFGILLFGPKLIRMVGEQITKLNPMRAYCVALSVAITVIVASWFGLPVSSTHIAVGSVFGVGFFREWYTANSKRRKRYIENKLAKSRAESDAGPPEASREVPGDHEGEAPALSGEEAKRRRLVRRAHVTTIIAAWIVTVPATALFAGVIFVLLNAFI